MLDKYELPSRGFAALKWRPFPEVCPDIDDTVLVVSKIVGLIADVAVYRGFEEDGKTHRFILSDVTLDPAKIIATAEIQLPKLITQPSLKGD